MQGDASVLFAVIGCLFPLEKFEENAAADESKHNQHQKRGRAQTAAATVAAVGGALLIDFFDNMRASEILRAKANFNDADAP